MNTHIWLNARRRSLVVAAVLIALHLGAFVARQHLGTAEPTDAIEYRWAAQNLRAHGYAYAGDLAQPFRAEWVTKRPPLYPALLAFSTGGQGNDGWLFALQAMLSMVSLWLLRHIFITLWPHRWRDGYFLLFMVLIPSQLIYANLLMAEIMFQGWLVAVIASLLYYEKTHQLRWQWAAYLLLALAAFIKPIFYPIAIAAPLLAAIFSQSHGLRRSWLITWLPTITVLLYFFWNQHRTGVYTFSSIQTINLVDYNTYYFKVWRQEPVAALRWLDAVHAVGDTMSSYPARDQFFRGAAIEALAADPLAYSFFHLRGVLGFFLDPGRFDLYQFFGMNSPDEPGILFHFAHWGMAGVWSYLSTIPLWLLAYLGCTLLANLVKAVGLLAMSFYVLRHRRHLPYLTTCGWLLALVWMLALLTGPLGASRFALPVAPFLIGAGVWLTSTWHTR